jgi:hypothetical protein
LIRVCDWEHDDLCPNLTSIPLLAGNLEVAGEEAFHRVAVGCHQCLMAPRICEGIEVEPKHVASSLGRVVAEQTHIFPMLLSECPATYALQELVVLCGKCLSLGLVHRPVGMLRR